jgi:hypothetical protein
MEGNEVLSLPKDRRRRRVVKAAAAATAGIAAVGAFFAVQANADQPDASFKTPQVYTDSTVGCAWVGDATRNLYGWIPTGYKPGWYNGGIHVPVMDTMTVKTYATDCTTLQQDTSDYQSSKTVYAINTPSSLKYLWIDTSAHNSSTDRDIPIPSNQSAPNNFVLVSNRSGLVPLVCITWWNDYKDDNTAPDHHKCTRVAAGKKVTWQLPVWPRSTATYHPNPKVRLTVGPSGSSIGRIGFDPDPNRGNCYRETSSGSVHQVTDQACTEN